MEIPYEYTADGEEAQRSAQLEDDNEQFRAFVQSLLGKTGHMLTCENQVPKWPGKKMPACAGTCQQARRLLGLPDAGEWTTPTRLS